MDILFLALDVDLRLDRGDAIHTRGIASSWARAGHRVHLVVGGEGDGRGIPGVHITVRPVRGDLAILGCVKEVARSFRPDVIYERRFSPKISMTVSTVTGIPFAVEYNGIVDEEAAMQGRPLPNTRTRRLKTAVRVRMLRRAAAIVTVTDGLREIIIQRYGVEPERVFVAENGVDADLFRPMDQTEARASLGLPSGPLVCYVGNLVRWQGLDTLIQAMKALSPTVRLILVGDGPSRDHLARRVEELGLGGRVKFAGVVPHEKVPRYIAAADACAASFSSERNLKSGVSALKVMEYLACGRPAVVTAVPGAAELVKSSGCGLVVPPEDPNAFGAALAEVIQDPTYLAAALRASDFVRRERSWDRTAATVLGVFQKIVQDVRS